MYFFFFEMVLWMLSLKSWGNSTPKFTNLTDTNSRLNRNDFRFKPYRHGIFISTIFCFKVVLFLEIFVILIYDIYLKNKSKRTLNLHLYMFFIFIRICWYSLVCFMTSNWHITTMELMKLRIENPSSKRLSQKQCCWVSGLNLIACTLI